MITPQKLNLLIYQGATYSQQWSITDSVTGDSIDLVDKTATMEILKDYTSNKAVHTITTTVSATEGNIILTPLVVDTSLSKIAIVIPAEVTTSFPYELENSKPAFIARYTLKLISLDGTVERLLYGQIKVDPDVKAVL